ncbi:MAG: NapC/NirT family cytochrome c [Anaerolineales bacterium]|nr:NapC/NirT family cytochrome c [Anaerolineales bacterium]MCK5314080.1 NapC/NirT family cytochrome c [Anaerolineales bacterium]
MKRFLQKIKSFFFPPEGTPTWARVLPYALLGVLTLILLTGATYAWEYTNSPPFCGETCHTMPPEFTSYLTSPHARIDCVDCHIGKGFIATRITRKAGDAKHIISLAFKDYEFPIQAGELRPARETCELCHFPQKFSDDSLREIKSYENDLENTPTSTYLTLKTGGGSKREGLGRGIHWHIENQVEYLATDHGEQNIPYVRVINDDGSTVEYLEIGSDIDPSTIDPDELKEMDCITCHNRITHLVLTPEKTVDELMVKGIISPDIPEIRLKAVEVYGASYETTQMGLNGIAGLTGYYEAYYPDYYAANKDTVDGAIAALQDAYGNSVFPEQKSDWNSHANNVGHEDSPGCFRCHDGKHLNEQDEAIRLECNLCHSIPVVTGPTDFVANIEISRGPEPESHLNPNWISLHRDVFDPTCENCHSTDNPGGTDNSSFCSNSACHGSVWEYAGFDAPGLREILLDQLPPAPTPIPIPAGGELTYAETIGPLLEARCGDCHGSNGIEGLNLTTYQTTIAGGNSGAAILPGDPDNSLIIIKQTDEQAHFGQFTSEELELTIEWIKIGSPEQ